MTNRHVLNNIWSVAMRLVKVTEWLLEISKVWKDITDINQAAILETIAGILIYLSIQKCILRTYLIAGNA